MSLSSASSKTKRGVRNRQFKAFGDHEEFVARITKSLYYGRAPAAEQLSFPVTELAAELFSQAKNGRSLDRLDLHRAAEISRKASISSCTLVLALLYLERLKSCNPQYLENVAPSELFVVSMMVASKFLHDDGEEDEVFNEDWAISAGIDIKEMNLLEKEFLNAINWEVFVNEQTFWTRLKGMENEVALQQGSRRGWFTYTDMDHLLDGVDVTKLAQTVLTVSAVCLTSYTASVLTLIGSALIVSHLQGVQQYISTSLQSPTPLVPESFSSVQTASDIPDVSKNLPAVDVLTTGLILASLGSCESLSESCHYPNTRNSTLLSWDWHGDGAYMSAEYLKWDWWDSEGKWDKWQTSGGSQSSVTSPSPDRDKHHDINNNSDQSISRDGRWTRILLQEESVVSESWKSAVKSCLDEVLKINPHKVVFPTEVAVSC